MKSWIYHLCLEAILRICRKDQFYATMFIAEAEVLRGELKIPKRVLSPVEKFVATTRRDLRA